MSYKDSEYYGYINGKLLWFAHYGLMDTIGDSVLEHCGDCQGDENDSCSDCVAYRAESILERQVIDAGIEFMTNLAKGWRKVNRQKK